MPFCTQCGSALAEDGQFCGNCGHRVKHDAVDQALQASPSNRPSVWQESSEADPSLARETEPALRCTHCGLSSPPGATYCDCGYNFRTGKVASSDRTRAAGPSGVGGWLALLTVGLLVLGPLMGAGRINADFMSAESQNPGLKTVGQWTNFRAVTWAAFLGFAAVSAYAGWGLARGQHWSVVRRAKIGLWIAGPLSNVVLGVVVPVATLGSTPGFDAGAIVVPFVGAFLTSVIAATVWTAYLSKSKRVRATYGNATDSGAP